MFFTIYLCMTWFLAGFLTGVTSFGGNLLAIPLLTLFLNARDSILFGCISGIVIFTALIIVYRRAILWRETIYIAISAFFGVPIGVWILAHASSSFLLLAAGASIGLFLIWQFFASRLHVSQKPVSILFSIPFGFLAGLMMSAIGMGGPPIVLHAYLRQWGKENTISSVNLAAGFITMVMIPAQWQTGLYANIRWDLALWGAVFAFLGTLASIPFEKRVNIVFFRRLLLATLALSSLMLILRGIMAWSLH